MDTPLCPRCHRDLTAGTARERLVWACSMCGGVWLDGATGTQLVNKLDDVAVGMAEGAAQKATFRRGTMAAAKCPACAALLERISLRGVQIDVCSQHGTWFDRGELQEVAQRLKVAPGGGRTGALGAAAGAAAVGTVAAAAAIGASAASPNLLSSIGAGAAELAVEGGGDLLIEAPSAWWGACSRASSARPHKGPVARQTVRESLLRKRSRIVPGHQRCEVVMQPHGPIASAQVASASGAAERVDRHRTTLREQQLDIIAHAGYGSRRLVTLLLPRQVGVDGRDVGGELRPFRARQSAGESEAAGAGPTV
jgi:Zn-finger nucleic acid-binding protein